MAKRDKRRKKNSRDRPVPGNIETKYQDVTLSTKKKAITLLCECLESHNVNSNERKQIIEDIIKALDLPSNFIEFNNNNGDDDDVVVAKEETKANEPSNDDISVETPNHNANANPNRRTSSRLVTSNSNSNSSSSSGNTDSNKKSKKSGFQDEHNEFCDVCNTGGSLLCCDSCSLVFHLGCIRPEITEVPKGKWSCSYCIVDDLGQGDIKSARKAIKQMKLLSKGIDTDDESEKMKEVSIVKSGSKYVSRIVSKKVTSEIGRFSTLSEALISIEQLTKNKTDENDESKDEKDELWCTHCIDDPEISICGFCGCQICLGKHDSDYLIICDGCDAEIHTYCCTPPLIAVPASEKWYCSKCIENVKIEEPKKKKIRIESEQSETLKLSTPKTENFPKSPASRDNTSINHDVVGVDNALLLISRFSTNGCSEKDKHFLQLLKQYCPYNDMVVVLKALEEQRYLIETLLNDSSNVDNHVVDNEINETVINKDNNDLLIN